MKHILLALTIGLASSATAIGGQRFLTVWTPPPASLRVQPSSPRSRGIGRY